MTGESRLDPPCGWPIGGGAVPVARPATPLAPAHAPPADADPPTGPPAGARAALLVERAPIGAGGVPMAQPATALVPARAPVHALTLLLSGDDDAGRVAPPARPKVRSEQVKEKQIGVAFLGCFTTTEGALSGRNSFHFQRPPNEKDVAKDLDFSTQPWPNMSEFVNREFGTQILNETLLGWLHDAKMEPEPLRPRKKYRCDAQWVVAGVPIARSSGWLRGVACAAQDGLAEATLTTLRDRFGGASVLHDAWRAQHPDDADLPAHELFTKIVDRLRSDYEEPRVRAIESLKTGQPLPPPTAAAPSDAELPAAGQPSESSGPGIGRAQADHLVAQLRVLGQQYLDHLEEEGRIDDVGSTAGDAREHKEIVFDAFFSWLSGDEP